VLSNNPTLHLWRFKILSHFKSSRV
jgi:hypothetical protein